MFEKIKVKSDKGRECVVNVTYFKIIKIKNETYLRCVLRNGILTIPFEKVISIERDDF